MGFEQRLYEAVCDALPATTTRSFSADCGMSDNYYCSIQGQNLQMSVPAMLHLAEVMELRQRLGETTKPINDVLVMIADEIAQRQNKINSSSYRVQQIITKSIAKIAFERDNTYNLPPITMGWA